MKTPIQVWYEVELDSRDKTDKQIAADMRLSFDEFRLPPAHDILVKMSKEYYNSTIEFNFMKETFSVELHNKIKKFLNAVISKFKLRVYWTAPSFVWTHIHFFRSELDSMHSDIILRILLRFIIDNISDLHHNSVERVVCSHQLWWHYAYNNPVIKEIRARILWDEFMYQDSSRNRPKYVPVLRSPRSSVWKMKSTEIRLIPTEFILNDKILIFLEKLTNQEIPNEDVPTLYQQLAEHLLWLRWKNHD